MFYRKSIFEKDGKFKFLLFEERKDHPPSLCESFESPSIFDMSCTVIQVTHFNDAQGLTDEHYKTQRDRLELCGWTFRGEAHDELPIGMQKSVR